MDNATILIADDNAADVLLLQRILDALSVSHSVQVVHDGEQVIAYLSGTGNFSDRSVYPFPSLLILDMGMPKVSGQEVLDWLKGRPELEKMFVVILSGTARSKEGSKMFEQHGNICVFNSHFLKPATKVSVEGLLNLCESWLRRN